MKIKTDPYVRIINGVKHIIYPDHLKEQIVGELENGTLSIKEALSKYQIHQVQTIQQYRRTWLDTATKHRLVRQIDSGQLDIAEVSAKYHVTVETIKDWLKQYSCGPISNKKPQTMETAPSDIGKQEQSLQGIIEQQKLKIASLEAIIDIAEKQYDIPIRKNSGTKQ
jgi:transposase-like protein